MKNKYTIIVTALLVLVMISCKKTGSEIEATYLATSVEKLPLNSNIKWVVILPGLGCHGCIEEAEVFMQEHINDRNIFLY